MPVGFKWFAPGLFDGTVCFGGEESRRRQLPPARRHRLDHRQRRPHPRPARRRDHRRHRQRPRRALPGTHRRSSATPSTPASTPPPRPSRRSKLKKLSPETVKADRTGRRADHRQAHQAPGNNAAIGGLKVTTAKRLVRRPPLRHRKHLQNLRRELPRRRPPRRRSSPKPNRSSPTPWLSGGRNGRARLLPILESLITDQPRSWCRIRLWPRSDQQRLLIALHSLDVSRHSRDPQNPIPANRPALLPLLQLL